MSVAPNWDARHAYRRQKGRTGTVTRLDYHARDLQHRLRTTAPGSLDPLEVMRHHRKPAVRYDPRDPHAETRAEMYWHARKQANWPVASKLRQTDMLAMAARCVTDIQRLRTTWKGIQT